MTDYVSFECVHIAEANQNDPDERMALAYADIDGYPADEDGQGTVICRVWMMREKDGIYPAYLIDWHYNAYRCNESVLELIKQAKEDLKDYKNNIVEAVFVRAYNRYKLKWMLDNGYTLKEFLEKVLIQKNGDLLAALEDFEVNIGFDGNHCEIWDDEDSFRETLWNNKEYMAELLSSNDFRIWLSQ